MSDTQLLNEPPSRQRRVWIVLAVVFFLISQIAIPTSYYLAGHPTSERFAWRMFSSVDLSTWKAEVTVMVRQNDKLIQQAEPIGSYLQETYVKSIQSAQFDVVEPFMRRLMQRPGVEEVRFHAQGTFPSGKRMEPIQCVLRQDGVFEIISG